MKKTSFFLLLLLFTTHAFSFEIRYEAIQKEDLRFVKENRDKLHQAFLEIIQYFAGDQTRKILVEILPFTKNKSFKSCARIYGPHRIYAHSPKYLQDNKEAAITSGINRFCTERNYNDLFYTLIHEFIHTETLILTKDAPPRWIWEGIAVALSGQLSTSYGKSCLKKISKRETINACKEFEKIHEYMEAGPLFHYYESKKKGFIINFLKRNEFTLQAMAKYIKENSLQCEVSIKDLKNYM